MPSGLRDKLLKLSAISRRRLSFSDAAARAAASMSSLRAVSSGLSGGLSPPVGSRGGFRGHLRHLVDLFDERGEALALLLGHRGRLGAGRRLLVGVQLLLHAQLHHPDLELDEAEETQRQGAADRGCRRRGSRAACLCAGRQRRVFSLPDQPSLRARVGNGRGARRSPGCSAMARKVRPSARRRRASAHCSGVYLAANVMGSDSAMGAEGECHAANARRCRAQGQVGSLGERGTRPRPVPVDFSSDRCWCMMRSRQQQGAGKHAIFEMIANL